MECKQLGKVAVRRIELPTPFPVGPVNSYVLQQGTENVLVDCGPKTDTAKAVLLDGLHELGLEPTDLTAVVLTHGHVDHVGLCHFFQSQGIQVYSHPDVESWLDPGGPWDEYRKDFYLRYYAQMGMPQQEIERALTELSLFVRWNDRSVVDVQLRHGDVFAPMPNFRIVEVPGHAQAAIALYDEETGEMLVGDQVLPHISSNALIEPTLRAKRGRDASYTHSLLDYRQNLQYLRKLGLQRIYPGHGVAFSDVDGLLDKRLKQQESRREEMLKLVLADQPVSAYDVAATYFAHRRDQPSLILSETVGYLDWLKEEGVLQTICNEQGVVLWQRAARED